MTTRTLHPARRGVSLIESVLAAGLLAGALAASLHVVGQTSKVQTLETRRATALLLAADMIAELRTHTLAGTNGTTANKPGAKRLLFNDAEDFFGWSASPPVDAKGEALTTDDKWSRSVQAMYLRPDDFALSGVPTDVAVFTVTVAYEGQPVVSLQTVLTTEDHQ